MRWKATAAIDWLPPGPCIERIKRGAFLEAIAGGKVQLWIGHERSNGCVARQDDGSLLLIEDSVGLWFDATIPDTTAGDDALHLARGSGYRGCSVGMERVEDTWSTVDGIRHRVIHRAGLREISLCIRGAYPSSRVAAGALPIKAMEAERRAARLASLMQL